MVRSELGTFSPIAPQILSPTHLLQMVIKTGNRFLTLAHLPKKLPLEFFRRIQKHIRLFGRKSVCPPVILNFLDFCPDRFLGASRLDCGCARLLPGGSHMDGGILGSHHVQRLAAVDIDRRVKGMAAM